MEALVAMMKEQAKAQASLVAEVKELRRQVRAKDGPATPATPTIPATAAPKLKKKSDEVNLCDSDSTSDSVTPVLPRRSPRKNKGLRKVKRERKDGAPLKRTISFEDSIQKNRARKCRAKSSEEKLLRKSLGCRLSSLDEDQLKGKFHKSNGKFKEDIFFIEVTPLIKKEIGSDFSDEELPARYVC